MNDRELLELAAKAARMTGWRYAGALGMCKMIDPSRPDATGSIGPNWNPFDDDGDALRLMVKTGLLADVNYDEEVSEVWGRDPLSRPAAIETHNGDPYAATRRAIVRAAAEIGRQMKEGGAS